MTVNGHVYLPILTMFLQALSALQPPGLSIVNDFLGQRAWRALAFALCTSPDGVSPLLRFGQLAIGLPRIDFPATSLARFIH